MVALNECRHQRSLPVIALDYVNGRIHSFHHFDRGPTEKEKSLGIVTIIAVLVSIQIGAREILRLIDKLDGHDATRQVTPQDSATDNATAWHIDREAHVGLLDRHL